MTSRGDAALHAQPDVLIVGAGPSGLVLAVVLAKHGVNFRIVDRKRGPVAQSRAALVQVRSLELLDGLGLAGRALERGIPIDQVEVGRRGRTPARFPLAGADAATCFPYALALPQDRVETLLVEALVEHGQSVEWGSVLDDLAVDGAVRAQVRSAAGVTETIRPRWVVGADGASSSVRRAMGASLAGTTYDQTGLLADVGLDADSGQLPVVGAIRLELTRGGFVGVVPLPQDRYRLFGAVPLWMATGSTGGAVSHEPYAALGIGELQRWFDEYFRVQATITDAAWASLFRVHSRMADRFHAGSTFLVGDAAHVHSPAGGQGMNLGIGDAVNLGWKLGLVTSGRADPGLLHSYEAERRPVARSVLRYTDRGFALETMSNPLAAWLREHVGTRLVGPLTRLPMVRRAVFAMFSQTWIDYRHSHAIVQGTQEGIRAGERLPRPCADEHDAVHHTLVLTMPLAERSGDPSDTVEAARRLGVPIAVRDMTADDRFARTDRGMYLLIRPDGHVGCVGTPDDTGSLEAYGALLQRSGGEPVHPAGCRPA